jgi:dTDP-4-dehydrorhamnose reductase
MMKCIVYGWNGWIGGQLLKILDQLQMEYKTGLSRLENVADVEHEIKAYKPTHVITFAGRTSGTIGDKEYTTIDYLEQPGKFAENVRDNLFAPVSLANLARKHGFHLTYLGTGCIFQFDEAHPFGQEINGFDENALPNFFGSGYSLVKGYTDQLMHMYEDCVLNVRIRMPITGDYAKRNFITKILNYSKICSVPNSMTVLPELLPLLVDMIQKSTTGTINLTNPGLISHNEVLELYREHVNPEFKWDNFTMEEQNAILAAGRSNNYLDTTRLSTMYPQVRHIKDAIRELMVEMKNAPKNT